MYYSYSEITTLTIWSKRVEVLYLVNYANTSPDVSSMISITMESEIQD